LSNSGKPLENKPLYRLECRPENNIKKDVLRHIAFEDVNWADGGMLYYIQEFHDGKIFLTNLKGKVVPVLN
jgi:hypothetical protein